MDKIGKIPTVIYITGYHRSGSTLLDRLLGSVNNFHSCGEIIELWRRVLDHKSPCSCGKYVENCHFWKTVLKQTFGNSFKNLRNNVSEFAELFYSTINKRNLLNLYYPQIRSLPFQKKLENIKSIVKRLYRAITEVSGARVIVDSSKHPLYAKFLLDSNVIDLRLVHLVRDSRAVVYSYMRRKFVPEIGYTATRNPFQTALAWNLHNVLAEILRAKHKYVRIHYEDLATHPRQTIIHILETLGLIEEVGIDKDKALVSFRGENRVFLGRGHLVAGNAMRFKEGEIEIKPDEEWRTSLSLPYRIVVTLFTAPLLKKYGYTLNLENSQKIIGKNP